MRQSTSQEKKGDKILALYSEETSVSYCHKSLPLSSSMQHQILLEADALVFLQRLVPVRIHEIVSLGQLCHKKLLQKARKGIDQVFQMMYKGSNMSLVLVDLNFGY